MTDTQNTEDAATNVTGEMRLEEQRPATARKRRKVALGRQSMTVERCEEVGLSPSVYGLKTSGRKKGRR